MEKIFVTTVSNKTVERNRARKIGDSFYEIGVDVHSIDGRWYTNKKLQTDNFTKKLVIASTVNLNSCLNSKFEIVKSSRVVVVVLSLKRVSSYKIPSEIIYCNNLELNLAALLFCESEVENIKHAGITVYDLNDYGIRLPENTVIDKVFEEDLRKMILPPARRPKVYSVTSDTVFNEYVFEPSKKFDFLKPVLKNNTYGFEFETCQGNSFYKWVNPYGFTILYDGSITGPEYASKIMVLEEFEKVEQFLKYLKIGHKTNNSCSTHIHIGGVPYTDENYMALFILFRRLQDEIDQLVYPYKRKAEFLASKKEKFKDHCKPFPLLPKVTVEEIDKLFFSRMMPTDYFKTSEGERRLSEIQKWNQYSRYYFVNFTNYRIKRNGTIELRLLQGTLNFDRILFWLAINKAIIEFALENKKLIFDNKQKITLQDVILDQFNYDIKLQTTIFAFIREMQVEYDNYLQTGEIKLGEDFHNERDVLRNSLLKS